MRFKGGAGRKCKHAIQVRFGIGAGCKVQGKCERQKCETKSRHEFERCKATMWQNASRKIRLM